MYVCDKCLVTSIDILELVSSYYCYNQDRSCLIRTVQKFRITRIFSVANVPKLSSDTVRFRSCTFWHVRYEAKEMRENIEERVYSEIIERYIFGKASEAAEAKGKSQEKKRGRNCLRSMLFSLWLFYYSLPVCSNFLALEFYHKFNHLSLGFVPTSVDCEISVYKAQPAG